MAASRHHVLLHGLLGLAVRAINNCIGAARVRCSGRFRVFQELSLGASGLFEASGGLARCTGFLVAHGSLHAVVQQSCPAAIAFD
jgi:hypothetical protein